MILIVAGAIILLLFITQFSSKATYEESINTCRFSVLAQVATELKPGLSGAKSPLDINCDKRYVKFYNTKVELGLNPENMKPKEIQIEGEKTKRFKVLTDQVVNQVIAEELRICKFQFADGKVAIFTNDEHFFADKAVCFVCSEITFSNLNTQKIESLIEYTKKTSFDDTGTTYYDYLTEETVYGNSMWLEPEENPDSLIIDTSKKYAVYVWRYNRAHLSLYKNGIRVNIRPYDELNNVCNLQAS
jgi:hypothetical protein